MDTILGFCNCLIEIIIRIKIKRRKWVEYLQQRKKYNRYSLIVLVFCMIVSLFPNRFVQAASVPKVSAHAYVVMDGATGKVLYQKNQNKKIYPASAAKLMTAIVALESDKTKKTVHVTKKILDQVESGTSNAGIVVGGKYSFSTLLHMLLLPSGADAAYALVNATYGSRRDFITAMNKKAKELGMKHTSFDNPVGLDIGNQYNKTYTTAKDYAVLTYYAMSNPTIRSIVRKKSYKVPSNATTKGFTIHNSNQFYTKYADTSLEYSIIGCKTGTTTAAGKVLMSTARDKDGHEIICAFFGNSGYEELYTDVRKLYDYTFSQYKKGAITLSKGCYDLRDTKNETLLNQYYEAGIVTATADGAFRPELKMTQKVFIGKVNKIADTSLKALEKEEKITLLAFANIMYQAYPIPVTKNEIAVIKQKLNGTYSKKEITVLTALYRSNILPQTYGYNGNTYLTKEDMIIIGDNLLHKKDTLEKKVAKHLSFSLKSTLPLVFQYHM